MRNPKVKIATETEAMGNKNAVPLKGPDTGTIPKDVSVDSVTGNILFSISKTARFQRNGTKILQRIR